MINVVKEMDVMKKMISILTVLVLLVLSLTVTAFAQTPSDRDSQIDFLLEKRAECICLEQWDEIASIDKELERLGVEKLSPEEVEERFTNTSGAEPYVSTPISNNVTWFSVRSVYPYNGVTYEIQTLSAQPNQNDSNLKQSGSRAISSSYKWKAGAMNALSVVATSIVGEIPGSSLYLSVYNSVKGFVSGISKTTEISSAEIIYSYAHTTTASFKYVKVEGQADSLQKLTYISTKGITAVGYQYPVFEGEGISVKPNIIQDSKTIVSSPIGYDSNLNAVKAYSDLYAKTSAYVLDVKITGIESKVVSYIYPVCPQFPAHIN